MSPRSRRRPSGEGRTPSDEVFAIFDGMLQHARELLAVRSPLDAELIVSEILGSWWGKRLEDGDVEEVIGEALVEHASRAGTPAALALLTGIAYLGTGRQAAKAERAALELMDRGVARPGWADRVGMVAPEACYLSRDVYGDQDSIVCTFTYGGEERHALVVLVDNNLGAKPSIRLRDGAGLAGNDPEHGADTPAAPGMVRDAWVSSQVDRLLAACRRDGHENTLMEFCELDPAWTRSRLEATLTATSRLVEPPVSPTFGAHHAFVRARVRALPPGGRLPGPTVYGPDRRATMAARFLASDEAEGLSDRSAASRCVDHIIDFGCGHDFGRPLRVSPVKCETFLLEWLPAKVLLSPTEQEAMPHVLAAWVRWAGHETGLPDEGVRATLDAVWDATGKFADAYHDPAAFGLERDLVERLLPDGDLEALPRRAFALPFLSGRHGTVDLSSLDPSSPADRRKILEFEHPGADEEHLNAHEWLAVRLWDNDPPELWETARSMLDVGYERHEILHRLIDVLSRFGHDPRALHGALHLLRHESPPG